MVSRVISILLLVSGLCAFSVSAQQSEAARNAFKQMKARADKGDAQSQFALGRMYGSGTGVSADQRKAVKYYTKAAEQGLAQAQFQLGLHYSNGEGVKLNAADAAFWFNKAAEQGLVEAELEMGRCYLAGKGLNANGVEAVKWFRKAADGDSAAAEFYLGKCYFDGAGVSRDVQAGLDYTRRSAEAGYALAQNALGGCYEKGVGIEKDYLQAYKWYALAAAQDDANAADIRVSIAKVESFLTKEQVAEAQRLAREFKPATAPGASSPNPIPTPWPGAGNFADIQEQQDGSNYGFVTVTAEDNVAEVFADGAFVGNAPAKLKLKQGAHIVEVKRVGFKDFQRQINITAGSDLTLRAASEKQ